MRMIGRFLEDFAVGQTFRSGRVRIDKERIKTFGAEFDPQPFHLDEEAARDTIFGGLAASGWHTAAVTMRLLVESDLTPARGQWTAIRARNAVSADVRGVPSRVVARSHSTLSIRTRSPRPHLRFPGSGDRSLPTLRLCDGHR